MQGHWEKWEPISGLENEYAIDSIEHTIKGSFKVVFSRARLEPIEEEDEEENYIFTKLGVPGPTYCFVTDKKNQVVITFKNGVYAYRQAPEVFSLNTYEILSDTFKTNFYAPWTFFKTTNSSYLKWLSEQSLGLADSYPLTHYSFSTDDVTLDVVTTCEPTVEIINLAITDEKK